MLILLILLIGLTNCYQIGHQYTFSYESLVSIKTPKNLDLEVSTFNANILIEPLKTNENSLLIRLTVTKIF